VQKLGKEGKLGHIWLGMRDIPEVLFIPKARFQRTKKSKLFREYNGEVLLPKILDLPPFVVDSKTTEAKFRLSGTISHPGIMEAAISFPLSAARIGIDVV
jgi:hypothetical protein